MSDEDFLWLINVLKKGSKEFQTLYNISFNIDTLILIERGEPKQWFNMTQKKRIREKPEEFLKFKVIREYFNNPNISIAQAIEIDSREPDYNQQFQNQQKQVNPRDNEFIFYFYTQYTRDQQSFQVIRPVTRKVAQDLLEKPTEYTEFLIQWQKIIAYNPLNKGGKSPQLYQVHLTQNFDKTQTKSVVYRKSIQQVPLKQEEFLKSDVPKQPPKFQDKVYKSLSSVINEKCLDFVKSIVRFLETQFGETIHNIIIDFFLNANNEIHLSGCDKIIFYDSQGEISLMDKNNMQYHKPVQEIPYKCPGIYCDNDGNNIFYEYNDELFSLFIPQSQEESQEIRHIQQKSILLDVIERFKTMEHIREVSDKNNLNFNLTEQMIFKCKKYYSIGDLAGSEEFRRLRVDNYYERVRVCTFCFHMYSKLDNMRLQQQSKEKRKRLTNDQILKIIQDIKGESGIIQGQLMSKKSQEKRFSKRFREKLQYFNIQTKLFVEEYDVQKKQDENYFYRSFQPQNTKIFTDNNYGKALKISKSQQVTKQQQKFQLPKIQAYTLTNKSKTVYKKQFFVNKHDSEALGLKHYLGHTKNLPYSDCGLAISKSSLALNQLQDKIQEVSKLRQKIENDKVKNVREEIEMMLCPYYGQGQSDQTKLQQFVDSLKSREVQNDNEEAEMKNKTVQVVTDKNEFLSENQKKIKQDKEQKDKDIENQKKRFLQEHMDLATSIQQSSLRNRRHNHQKHFSHAQTQKFPQKQQQIYNQQKSAKTPSLSSDNEDDYIEE